MAVGPGIGVRGRCSGASPTGRRLPRIQWTARRVRARPGVRTGPKHLVRLKANERNFLSLAGAQVGARESRSGCGGFHRRARRPPAGDTELLPLRASRKISGYPAGGDPPRPTCPQGPSRVGSSPRKVGEVSLRSAETGEPTCALESDQRLQSATHKSRFFGNSAEFPGPLHEPIVEINGSSHAYDDACFRHLCQGAAFASEQVRQL